MTASVGFSTIPVSTRCSRSVPVAVYWNIVLALLAGLLTGCQSSPGVQNGAVDAAFAFHTSPRYDIQLKLPIDLGEPSGEEGKSAEAEQLLPLLLRQVDEYMDYWQTTRVAWQARPEDVRPVVIETVADCAYPCVSSYNGLCSGSTDEVSWIKVAVYHLRRAEEAPPDWDLPGRYMHPRRGEDMRQLSSGQNSYWTQEEPNDYYWCERLPSKPLMPALLHEWDHVLSNMDPHDATDISLILRLPLSDFISGLLSSAG